MYIPTSSLLNEKDYDKISEFVTCSICKGIIYEPIQCKNCQNNFCKVCINKWNETSTTCPFRCKNAKYIEGKIIKKLLSKLQFICINECDQILNYNDLNDHYNRRCPKMNYKEKINDLEIEISEIEPKINELKNINKQLTIQIEKFSKLNPSSNKGNNIQYGYSKFHNHSLKFSIRNSLWICDLCGLHFNKNNKSFNCIKCDFDICCQCYIREIFGIE